MTTIYTYAPSGRDEQAFRDGYVECALWANGQSELSDEDADTLHSEAYDFLADEHAVRLIQAAIVRGARRTAGPHYVRGYDWTSAGHDFYLTREGHGAGFWDRGLGIVGDALTALAKPYGSSDYLPEMED